MSYDEDHKNSPSPSDGGEASCKASSEQRTNQGNGSLSHQATVRAHQGCQEAAGAGCDVLPEWLHGESDDSVGPNQQPGETLEQWHYRRLIEIEQENSERMRKAKKRGKR